MTSPTILSLLPDRLRADVERAVARQLDDAAWRELLAYGEERARSLGHTESDVERLVAESRRGS